MTEHIRAAVCSEWARPIVVRDDVRIATPGPGQVRVALAASGVCHTDLGVWDQSIPMPVLPCVLGHEGAGTVVEVGDGVHNVAVGDHVVIVMPSCGYCRFCRRGESNICPNAIELGTMPAPFTLDGEQVVSGVFLGTFAEQTVVSARSVVPLPADLPLDEASLIGCGVLTGVGAVLNTARVAAGATVAVVGCGGVGSTVIQAAALAGAATVVAVDLSPARLEHAIRFGATHVATPDELPSVIGELTGGDGFDHTFEAVGRSDTIRLAIDSARRQGEVTIVGVGRLDDVVGVNAFEWVFGAKTIRGSMYGGGSPLVEVPRVIRLWAAGRLDIAGLIGERIALGDINDAIGALASGSARLRTLIEFSK